MQNLSVEVANVLNKSRQIVIATKYIVAQTIEKNKNTQI